ncbi:helix-turn-helix domain-containing protein [Nocardioides sp. CER19]|uniref:helix-turn-helix domain-containing protein n=1 Tax=Nocardioides sp. CER19 TaxID=3038538 RepID=UPI002446A241|nr:helix-turn-helix domain-containing protein [Nocardioides sp. CER19]MDH2415290.1 hypothetical protein [Nocardioides sp. CER19]
MGRPLTGRIKPTPTGFHASLPQASGSTRRIGGVLPTEADARAWLAQAITARQAGAPVLPVLDWLADQATPPASPPSHPPAVPLLSPDMTRAQPLTTAEALSTATAGAMSGALSFREVAEAYLHERYILGRQAGPDRERAERDLCEKLATYFEGTLQGTLGTLSRADYLAILCQWAGAVTGPLNKRISKRQQGNPDVHRGYAADLVRNMRGTLDRVLAYAWSVLGQTRSFDPAQVRTPRTDAGTTAPKRPLTLPETAALAAHLHPAHQIALWLLRLGGLRISEAFGLHVADLVVPDGADCGFLVVARQGGRVFWDRDRDGSLVPRHEVDRTKTTQSVRLVPIPRALAGLLTVVIDVFHTGPDGTVDQDARLIPDLTGHGSGQGSFRRTMKNAATRLDLDVSSDLFDGSELPVPHDLRKAVGTELALTELPEWIRKRALGHLPGADVHHRHYLLDDPTAAPYLAVADQLQAGIDADLPPLVAARLVVPTQERCTTGNQSALARRADEIDAELLETGWLVSPTEAGVDLLGPDEIADYLGLSPVTARRYLRDGTLPSRRLPHGRADQKAATLADVEELRAALATGTTMADLAAELDYNVSSLHQAAARLGLTLEKRGRITIVPHATRTALTAWALRQHQLRTDGYTHDEAAALLGVSVPTIRHLITARILVALPTGNGERARVSKHSVDTADLQRSHRRPRRRAA